MRLKRTVSANNPLGLRTRFECEILRRYNTSEVLAVDIMQNKSLLSSDANPSEALEYEQRKAWTELTNKLYALLKSSEEARRG